MNGEEEWGHAAPRVGVLGWEVEGQDVTGRPPLQLQMMMGP